MPDPRIKTQFDAEEVTMNAAYFAYEELEDDEEEDD